MQWRLLDWLAALGLRRRTAVVWTCLLLTLAASAPAALAKRQSEPGKYDYLTLVLSWSPTYCAEKGRNDGPQCAGPRPYAFVLHGLWPQYHRGWPKDCRTRERPWVPRPVIDAMLDIMPNPRLVIHEFRKHGVCSGLVPSAYFDLARTIFESVQIPAHFQQPERTIETTADALEADFLTANPQLSAEGISIVCGRRGRLRELRLCFSREGTPIACGVNESQGKLCAQGALELPPVR